MNLSGFFWKEKILFFGLKKSKIVELLNSRQKYVSNRMSFTALFRDGLPEIMDAIKEKLAFVEQRRGYLVFGVEHA
jgi:hypothetical protein